MRVSLINAGRDIVDPLSDQMRKNLLDDHDFLTTIQTENASYMTRMIEAIGSLNKDEENSNRGLILAFRQFMRHPVWMTLNFIGGALKTAVTTTASALWTIAFGKKDKKLTTEEQILQAIKDQTEFFVKGSIDKTKSFWDRLTSGGLIGAPIKALGRGILSGVGISQSTAQQREAEKSQGKSQLKGGLWGKFSDFVYGSEIQKFGRQGGILSQAKQQSECETKDCRRKTKPEYTYDVNLVELPSIMKKLFQDQGEIVKHQIEGQDQYFRIFNGYIDVIEQIEKDTTSTVHELKKQNRRSFIGMLMSGITGTISAIGSVASAIFAGAGVIVSALAPIGSILAAGFALIAKEIKEAGMKMLLLVKAGWDLAKDVFDTVFKKGNKTTTVPGDIGTEGAKDKKDAPKDSKKGGILDKIPNKKMWLGGALLGGAAGTGLGAMFYPGAVGEGSDALGKTKERLEYERFVESKKNPFAVVDVLGTKEAKLKAAADEADKKMLELWKPSQNLKQQEAQELTFDGLMGQVKDLITQDTKQTDYLKKMTDAVEELKQITMDPQGYADRYKELMGKISPTASNALGVSQTPAINFGTVPDTNAPAVPNLRERLFKVDPNQAFGKDEPSIIPDQPMSVTFPEANVPIPPQSSIGDGKMVQLLSSIDSKLSNIGQGQSESTMGFGNDSNTILNIYGGVA